MATQIKSKAGLKKAYANSSSEIRDYFPHIPELLENFPMEVCLAYVFYRLELGQNMALYTGVVRIHRVEASLARSAVSIQHLTREHFDELYQKIFSIKVPKTAKLDLEGAQKTRDRIMHGKRESDDQVRNAIARVLEYAEEINSQLDEKHKLKPFGYLKGFAGRGRKLDKQTSRFVLKGIGFGIA